MTLYFKVLQILLPNATIILLQNVSKVHFVNQNTTALLQYVTVLKKYDVYHKMRWYINQ